MLAEVNRLFGAMLAKFERGISNTSTSKYGDLKLAIADKLGIKVKDVYATGAVGRISNLDTRLAQGNLRNQNTALGLVFIKPEADTTIPESELLDRARNSFVSTCTKFVSGEERGTTFDGILGFSQLADKPQVEPLVFLYAPQCSYLERVRAEFPGITEIAVPSHSPAANTALPGSQTSLDLPPIKSNVEGLLTSCAESLAKGGLHYSQSLLSRFLASLLTKRFVILAGLSGSGKTKLALSVGKWMEEVEGQVEVVAVGADWTSNESILGYRDALDESKYRRPTNGSLDIIIRAAKDPIRPYFLILDEMNLSHVERYFSDLLSAIETDLPIALHAADEDVEGVPPRVVLPLNLFVVGTVNIDETTYMFSPKVLDRANVIEFRLDATALNDFLVRPSPVRIEDIERKGAHFGPAFVTTAGEACSTAQLDSEDSERVAAAALYRKTLAELFAILHSVDAEFGFRTAFEIDRFICMHAKITGVGWTAISSLDAQVVQKLMPKLHGSERRLRPALQLLVDYCNAQGLTTSHEKASRMLERLKDGYVSFLG